MTTFDNEDIDFLKIPDVVIKSTYHFMDNETLDDNKWGDLLIQCSEANVPTPKICAKKTITPQTKVESYYILCAESMMYDPYNNDVRYRSRPWWKLRKVNFRAYNLYTQFLSSRRKTLLHQAEREV